MTIPKANFDKPQSARSMRLADRTFDLAIVIIHEVGLAEGTLVPRLPVNIVIVTDIPRMESYWKLSLLQFGIPDKAELSLLRAWPSR